MRSESSSDRSQQGAAFCTFPWWSCPWGMLCTRRLWISSWRFSWGAWTGLKRRLWRRRGAFVHTKSEKLYESYRYKATRCSFGTAFYLSYVTQYVRMTHYRTHIRLIGNTTQFSPHRGAPHGNTILYYADVLPGWINVNR